MINHEVVTSQSSSTTVTTESCQSTTETLHQESRTEVIKCHISKTESLVEEEKVVESHGGSISDRLAALQRSGEENWKKRLSRSMEEDILSLPKSKPRDKSSFSRPSSLLDRLMKLEESQDQWRNRVEGKDANQFTVAGKMGQMDQSPHGSPVLSRKKCTPKSVKIRSKTLHLQELSSCNSRSLPCIPGAFPLSKSKTISHVDSENCLLDLGKGTTRQKITHVFVPKVDDETFSSFFDSVTNRLSEDNIKINDEEFEVLSSESHELLVKKRGVKIQRKHASSSNPLKLLASRSDIQQEYEEIYMGVAERELERQKLEKLARGSDLALSALAGLASIVDFKSVTLRKSTLTDSNPLLSNTNLMLIQVKGRRHVQTRLMEPIGPSMNHGDSYILVTPSQVYCWQGEFSNIIERAKAAETATLVQSTKDLCFKGCSEVSIIEEDNEADAENQKLLFEAVGINMDDIKPAGPADEDELYETAIVSTNSIYSVENDELVPCDEYWGRLPKIEMLKPEQVFVFDFGSEMYVWQGKLASVELRRAGVSLGKELWEDGYNYSECDINPLNPVFDGSSSKKGSKRPEWALFSKINQHMEPVLFKEKFVDWPNTHPLIANKKQVDEDIKVGSICDLKPCDVTAMLNNDVQEPDMILEGSHLGRGVEYHDEEERRHYQINTISRKVWHITEYNFKILPKESWGQFHSCDTYVVRWQYMITNIGRSLTGSASRHSFVGRKRWAYFFWQGENSTITEKGASALMTLELNEEKGPHVRVVGGREPPCFLNLFEGSMVVYKGRREESSCNNAWKLFNIRGELKSEAALIEVSCCVQSLRSRSSFVLVNTNSGCIFVWHGCKSSNETRNIVTSAVSTLTSRSPPEMRLPLDVQWEVKELQEGSECKEFWDGLGEENRSLYFSLLKSDLSFDFTPRLFFLTSISGELSAKEIVCPYFTKKHSCAFTFFQSDLGNASQPALFLLDNNHEVFLWQGWLPSGSKETDNLATGSASVRWDVNRRVAMEVTLQYCQAKNKEVPKAFVVCAGAEPLVFTNLFPEWQQWKDETFLNEEETEQSSKMMFVQEALSQLARTRYTLQELQQQPRPAGVDPSRLESYLTEEEFKEVLGMEKEDFYNLPSWKQSVMKKSSGLF